MGPQHEAWWLQPRGCPIAIAIPEGYRAEFKFKQQHFAISTLCVDQRPCFQLQRRQMPDVRPSRNNSPSGSRRSQRRAQRLPPLKPQLSQQPPASWATAGDSAEESLSAFRWALHAAVGLPADAHLGSFGVS